MEGTVVPNNPLTTDPDGHKRNFQIDTIVWPNRVIYFPNFVIKIRRKRKLLGDVCSLF